MRAKNKAHKQKRIRRTSEEAKALILDTAGKRLAEFGLEGLNIAGVAGAAGMSHATVIHHFGSTAAMREALLAKMTGDLLADVMIALTEREEASDVLDHLFKMLSQDGHGRLLAWLSLDAQTSPFDSGNNERLFGRIIDSIASRGGSRTDAKHKVFLVTLAALGLGISGDSLADLIGLTEKEAGQFPVWLAEHIKSSGS